MGNDELGREVVSQACPTYFTYRDAACARLILDNLDAWSEAWRADQQRSGSVHRNRRWGDDYGSQNPKAALYTRVA